MCQIESVLRFPALNLIPSESILLALASQMCMIGQAPHDSYYISEMADLLVIVNYIMVMEPINLATSESI